MSLLKKTIDRLAWLPIVLGVVFYGGSYRGNEIQGASTSLSLSLIALGVALIAGKWFYFNKIAAENE